MFEKEGASSETSRMQKQAENMTGQFVGNVKEASFETAEAVKEKSKETAKAVKKDVVTFQKWITTFTKAVGTLYVAGFRDSLIFTVPHHITPKFKKEVGIPILRFLVIVTLWIILAKPFLKGYIYWPFLLYVNEAINYKINLYLYAQSLPGMYDAVAEKFQKKFDTLTQNVSKFSEREDVSGLRKRLVRAFSSSSNVAGDETPEDPSVKRTRRREVSSQLLARVVVAKIMSYCLIANYVYEMFGYMDGHYTRLFDIIDILTYALLYSFFVGENKLILRGFGFSERVDWLWQHVFYNLGYGTIAVLLFTYLPPVYGELCVAYLHLASLCTHHGEKADEKANIDLIAIAEKVCFKIVEYVI